MQRPRACSSAQRLAQPDGGGSCEVDGADLESTRGDADADAEDTRSDSRAGEAEAKDVGIDCDRHGDTARPGDIYLAVASLIVELSAPTAKKPHKSRPSIIIEKKPSGRRGS